MGLDVFVTHRKQRGELLSPAQPVIDSNSLREAALRASWYRDHRVSRRREAWRWAVFWAWKYGPKAVAIVLPIIVMLYVVLGYRAGSFKQQPTADITLSAPLAQTTSIGPSNMLPDEIKEGIRLVPSSALLTTAARPSLSQRPPDESNLPSSQPLRLTPEIQPTPKESAP